MRRTYLTAKKFLIRELADPDAKAILESYLSLPDQSDKPISLNRLFERLLRSAQNANMKASVVGGSIGGIHNLGRVLFRFNPRKVERAFANNPEGLLDCIVKTLNPSGQIRTTSHSIWPKYCKTILSAATFFRQFKNGEDFYDWANHFYGDQRSMAALPMVLAAEIDGIGYPLACDFLKELGFVSYGKPDVHVIQIFAGIGLCPERASPYQVQKVIAQIAEASGVSSYNVDKVFWLIGSGKFYRHSNIGNIGSKKAKFIAEFNDAHLGVHRTLRDRAPQRR
ncbi:hypothetical protein [Burkholderia stagnalis]|uniref:hypothetical protein n=2 Tax=Burkholderia stagnalis TaxID=1503054 RepID=UPI0018C768DE|nr:hypothetical protein [Burkholderia stagnalis]